MIGLERLEISDSVYSLRERVKSVEKVKISKTVYPDKPDEVYEGEVKLKGKSTADLVKKEPLRISKTVCVFKKPVYTEWQNHINQQILSFKGYRTSSNEINDSWLNSISNETAN